MSEFSHMWVGPVGVGVGVIAGLGMKVYEARLYQMNGNPVPIDATIVSMRVGPAVAIGAGIGICILTGVPTAASFNTLESEGWDWTLSFGEQWDKYLKGIGTEASLGEKIIKGFGTLQAGLSERRNIYKLGRLIHGQIKTPRDGAFTIIPVPGANKGIGAGFWYQYSKLYKYGGDAVWRHLRPQWRVKAVNGSPMLQMRGIPETGTKDLCLRVSIKRWGADDKFLFRQSGPKRKGFGDSRTNFFCYCHKHQLRDFNRLSSFGIDLATLPITGVYEGATLFGSSEKLEVLKDQEVEIGFSLGKVGETGSQRTVWSSNDYTKVRLDRAGRIAKSLSHHQTWLD